MSKIDATIQILLAEIETARQSHNLDLAGQYIRDLSHAVEKLAFARYHETLTEIAYDEHFGHAGNGTCH